MNAHKVIRAAALTGSLMLSQDPALAGEAVLEAEPLAAASDSFPEQRTRQEKAEFASAESAPARPDPREIKEMLRNRAMGVGLNVGLWESLDLQGN
jgi:hypothetical protein